MTAPANQVSIQGQGAVSADLLNTFLQGVANFSTAAAFPGTPGMTIYVWGFVTPGDGGQGVFVWNTTAGPSDGINVIQPSGVATGAWVRVGPSAGLLTASYIVEAPVTGFSIQIPNGVSSLILNPAGVLATGTVHLPTNPVDEQIVTINTMQAITALSLAATFPAIIIGAPAPTAFPQFGTSFQFSTSQNTWFRYG